MKKVSLLITAVLCSATLSACGAETAPAESAASVSAPASILASEKAVSEPVVFDETALKSYMETFSCFFHAPLRSSQDIPKDYSLGYFLLYQTFTANNGDSTYTQDENYFWQIPVSDLQETADEYLGLTDFSADEINEWPFGSSQQGIYNFTQETSLPYCNFAVEAVEYHADTNEATALVTVSDDEYEGSASEMQLLYTFQLNASSKGDTIYRLQSITEME